MFSVWELPLVAIGYVGLLFAVAYRGDRRRPSARLVRLRPLIYSLSLAVYCTSWTFYGAVGMAVTDGLAFLPIYLGPALLFLFGHRFIARVVRVSQEHNVTSIADLLSLRYGKSRAVAVLVTALAVAGGIPYIALQLKAVVLSLEVLGPVPARPDGALPALVTALVLATFAILFGTRELDATEHHRGLVQAVALESLVKLLAFLTVGLFALALLGGWGGLADTVAGSAPLARRLAPWPLPDAFVTSTLLAMAAVLCLPRQFHVAVVEYDSPRDLATARWLFPLYLGLFSLFVLPVAVAGLTRLPGGTVPDSFVLALPAEAGASWLALLAFLGGISAATAMVVVAAVALATMVSNDLVLPLLLRGREARRDDLAPLLLLVRRLTILLIALAAWAFLMVTGHRPALASIGLLAFAAVAQFAPPLVAGLYWRSASRDGALAGLAAGGLAWGYTLLLPTLLGPDSPFVRDGPLGLELLRPQALLGLDGLAPLTHGALWSVGANVLLLVGLSLLRRPSVAQRLMVRTLTGDAPELLLAGTPAPATLADLQGLAGRFVGRRNAALAFHQHGEEYGWGGRPDVRADATMLQFTERLLAGSIGTASARRVLSGALERAGLRSTDAERLLDTTSEVVRFNRKLLDATLDSIGQGVSVVDEKLNLVGWNQAYLDLFDYPPGLVHLGRPIGELIEHNARRGMLGDGDVEVHVLRRLDFMRRGRPYRVERRWPDGRYVELQGRPMPGGGYVTTYTDVTEYRRAERALEEINATLEQRVAQRTGELTDAVAALEVAKSEAEAANRARSRFLAAASHDLLQPLNAARLFASVLSQQTGEMAPRHAELVERVDASLTAAEELLSALLDISKLDRGVLQPQVEPVAVAEILGQLSKQFAPLVLESGLTFRVRRCEAVVASDRQLLRRIVQNYVANAFRYTPGGGILLGCRRRGGAVRIAVWDTGPGIAATEQERIFREFHREERAHVRGQKGLGLGLAISRRMAGTLGHAIGLRSRVGRGSCFWVEVPIAAGAVRARADHEPAPLPAGASLVGLRVLCVDNDAAIREGMLALLERWGCRARAVEDEARWRTTLDAGFDPEVVLLDYRLDGIDGLTVFDRLAGRMPRAQVVLVTAERSEEVTECAAARGLRILRKPLRPARLRSLLTRLRGG